MQALSLQVTSDMEYNTIDCGEICTMYRQAADKKAQVKIISELYLISRAEVCEILLEGGAADEYINSILHRRKKASKGNGWNAEEERLLRKLRNEKRSYTECALILGRSKGSISAKVLQLGLTREGQKCL